MSSKVIEIARQDGLQQVATESLQEPVLTGDWPVLPGDIGSVISLFSRRGR